MVTSQSQAPRWCRRHMLWSICAYIQIYASDVNTWITGLYYQGGVGARCRSGQGNAGHRSGWIPQSISGDCTKTSAYNYAVFCFVSFLHMFSLTAKSLMLKSPTWTKWDFLPKSGHWAFLSLLTCCLSITSFIQIRIHPSLHRLQMCVWKMYGWQPESCERSARSCTYCGYSRGCQWDCTYFTVCMDLTLSFLSFLSSSFVIAPLFSLLLARWKKTTLVHSIRLVKNLYVYHIPSHRWRVFMPIDVPLPLLGIRTC